MVHNATNQEQQRFRKEAMPEDLHSQESKAFIEMER
jgi:hypothetical protein